MSFRFNFFDDDRYSSSQNSDVGSTSSCVVPKEHPYDRENITLLFSQWVEVKLLDDLGLFYLNNVDKGKMETVTEHSDLVPNVYEGGFEVWECTIDILKYFARHEDKFANMDAVLDLGCGSGLLGIYMALRHHPETVHFQDYNPEVIENFTIKNYHKNCSLPSGVDLVGISPPPPSPSSARFFSGDWDDMEGFFETYHLIISSETIYNRDSISKVLRIIARHLRREGGVALIGTKRHYFGTLLGGGLVEFQEQLKGYPELKSTVVWSSEKGLTRDIVLVTFK